MKNRMGFKMQPILAVAIPVLIFGTIFYLMDRAQKKKKKTIEYVNPRNIEIGEPDNISYNDSVYIFSKKLDTVYYYPKKKYAEIE